jgi:Animal haem peroxidase
MMMNKKLILLAVCALNVGFYTASNLADTVNARFPEFPKDKEHVFTRMFKNLPPFAPQTDRYRTGVQQIGAKGGILDAKDNLTDPIQSILNPAVFSPNNPDNPTMTSGVTFFGQFLDHDITLDKKSELLKKANPRKTINFRTAAFDLDSLYGNGPDDSPEIYDKSSGFIKFIVEAIPGSEAVSRHGAVRYDLPRDANGDAIVPESRNDENVVISQFHLAMLKFHNAVTDQLIAQYGGDSSKVNLIFNEAQKIVRWHYQWIILHEFLPQTIGQDRLNSILAAKRSSSYDMEDADNYHVVGEGKYAVKTPRIPIEFSVAAYRFGHSQVRPSYRANFGPTGGSPFFAFIFDDSIDGNPADPADLRGGTRAPRRFVDWQTFFNFGDGNFRQNKRIDAKLSSPLMLLPGIKAAAPGLPNDGEQSLASRNLMRHVNFGIPSGQAIAKKIGVTALTPVQLADMAPYGLEKSTPLWFYILKEAEVMENGFRLGPVGSHIVGEVFVGLLRADKTAYLNSNPTWTPTLPSANPGTFKITDLLNFAGVVPPL